MVKIRPDAMTLEVSLGCAVYGTTDPITLEDGTEVPGEPRVVKISGRFGELDPLSTEDAAVVLAQLQRLRLQQQAAAQAAARKQAEEAAAAESEEDEESIAHGGDSRDEEASDAE